MGSTHEMKDLVRRRETSTLANKQPPLGHGWSHNGTDGGRRTYRGVVWKLEGGDSWKRGGEIRQKLRRNNQWLMAIS